MAFDRSVTKRLITRCNNNYISQLKKATASYDAPYVFGFPLIVWVSPLCCFYSTCKNYKEENLSLIS